MSALLWAESALGCPESCSSLQRCEESQSAHLQETFIISSGKNTSVLCTLDEEVPFLLTVWDSVVSEEIFFFFDFLSDFTGSSMDASICCWHTWMAVSVWVSIFSTNEMYLNNETNSLIGYHLAKTIQRTFYIPRLFCFASIYGSRPKVSWKV